MAPDRSSRHREARSSGRAACGLPRKRAEQPSLGGTGRPAQLQLTDRYRHGVADHRRVVAAFAVEPGHQPLAQGGAGDGEQVAGGSQIAHRPVSSISRTRVSRSNSSTGRTWAVRASSKEASAPAKWRDACISAITAQRTVPITSQ